MQREQKFWIVTASADHAQNGREAGVVQACHGKAAQLRRMQPGDGVTIYSPKTQFGGGTPLQAFTAIGRVAEGAPYQYEMTPDFIPWRRAVKWQTTAMPLPIRPLLDALDFTRGKPTWGMVFRFGLLQISRPDFALIARQMVPEAQVLSFGA
jgi:hypothetical protein